MSRARECGSKVPYRHRREADAKAFQMKRTLFTAMHCYKCKYCGFWHIGHTKNTRRSSK